MENLQFETLVQSLSPALQNLEQKRLALKQKGRNTGLKIGGAILALGIVISLATSLSWIALLIAVVIAIGVWFNCINTQSTELSSYYKEEVIGQILHTFCQEASFTPGQGIRESEFQNCGLFSSPDRYHTEDLMQGCVGKTEFRCAEVHAEVRRTRVNSKGHTTHYWEDIFKGFIFVADFHKDFQGQTLIRRNSLIKFNFNGSRVKLEDPAFEKAFDVYSTDQVEARYLLSPSMMERLLALDKKFDSEITLSFRNSTILIAIPASKNHFEASIWRPLDTIDALKEDFSAIEMLLSIVEDLNLNTRIWSKE